MAREQVLIRWREHGFVLITALIFLVVLTLVAVTALKGTGLEMRMSANNAMHTEAQESSEAPRQIVARLIEVLGFNAETGWPTSIYGATPVNQFAYTIPSSISIYAANGTPATSGNPPANWFVDIPESGFGYTNFTPVARYEGNVATSGASFQMAADIEVQRMRSARTTGCDLTTGGYDRVSPCLDIYFHISSQGVDPTNAATYETSSVYRYTPRN